MNKSEKVRGIDKLGRSTVALSALFVTLMSLLLICSFTRLYPYMAPVDACFARNGVFVSSLAKCRGLKLQRIEERSMGAIEKSARHVIVSCEKECARKKQCSYYSLEYENNDPSLGVTGFQTYKCSLYE